MVGGSSQIPNLKTSLKKFFNNDEINFCSDIDPNTVVAYGAAVMSGVLESGTDLVLNDVVPMTLGVTEEFEIKKGFLRSFFSSVEYT